MGLFRTTHKESAMNVLGCTSVPVIRVEMVVGTMRPDGRQLKVGETSDGQEGFTNDAMEFGSRFDKAVEDDEETGDLEIDFGLLHIPAYPKRQVEMMAKIKGVTLLGKVDALDNRCPDCKKVYEK